MSDLTGSYMDDLESYRDEAYFDRARRRRVFDSELLRQPNEVLRSRKPLILPPDASATDAIRAMQGEHRGCVLVTPDGSSATPLVGIFTERDVLFRIVDRGRNPVTLPLSEVMTADPEHLRVDHTIAAVLHMMSVGGFRHVPVVDAKGCPSCVISVRDVVEFLVESFPRVVLNDAGLVDRSAPPTREGA